MKRCEFSPRKWRRAALLSAIFFLSFEFMADEDLSQEDEVAQFDIGSTRNTRDPSTFLAKHPSSFDHIVALYTTLSDAGIEELRRLLDDSHHIAHTSVRHDTQFAIASALSRINPQDALEAAMGYSPGEREQLIAGVFAEWSNSDLEGAVAAAVSLDRDERRIVLNTISEMRDDLTVQELRAIARKLGHNQTAMDLESDSTAVELEDSPMEAWLVLVHDGLEDARQLQSLVLVAEAAIEERGLEALFHLRGPFAADLWESEILGAVVTALIKNDPKKTWAYIQNGSTTSPEPLNKQTELRESGIVSPRDVAYMTDVVQELLLKSWSVLEPSSVLERIEQVPRKLQALACERALSALVATEPERVVELIQSLRHLGSTKERSLWRIVSQWSGVDPSAALDWVLTAPNIEHVPSEDLLRPALIALVLEDAERALEVASKQQNAASLEAGVIEELARSDVEAALELLPSVSQEAEGWATQYVARILFNAGEADRALQLLSQLEESSENPEAVNWFMSFLGWASANPVQLFERLDDLPPKLRYWGAHALDYNFAPSLTQEQMDYVRAIREEGPP